MKTDKETIVGLVAAVELFMQRDYVAIYAEWEAMVAEMVAALAEVPHLSVRRGFPVEPGIQPADVPRVYIESDKTSAALLQEALRTGDQSIAVAVYGNEIVVNPQCLNRDEIVPLLAAISAAVA